jgi:hypothetical protein
MPEKQITRHFGLAQSGNLLGFFQAIQSAHDKSATVLELLHAMLTSD